ncbi:MAG: hypothetical protein V4592_02315 [Bacteroidota bacterium]
MSAEEKNKLDELFKNGLGTPETHSEFNDQHWNDLEQLMNADGRPRGIVYWLPRLGAVAAILLLFLGWWLFKPVPVKNEQVVGLKPSTVQPITVTKPDNKPTTTGSSTGVNSTNGSSTGSAPVNSAGIMPATVIPAAPVYAGTSGKHNRNIQHVTAQQPGSMKNNQVAPPANKVPQQEILATVDNKAKAPISNPVTITDNGVNTATNAVSDGQTVALTNTISPDAVVTKDPAAQVKKTKLSGASKFKPQFGLAMLVSPDINGAGSFQNAKIGTNIGLLFSVEITKKLTVSTGASYSKKPYLTDFDNYHVNYKFKTDPQDVYADCRVLDIPLNVDYKVYSKSRNSFSVGSGLSSYIMLKEKYTYDYAVPGTAGPSSFTVTNKNRHILGVLNLNATYEHQVNSKFSIAAQPYLKIPLTNIGNSQVRLQSAGVALGLRWNINRSVTP